MKKIFSVAAFIFSSHLFAQDSAKILDNVTLTASKFSVKTTQTGKVVTIITRQDIEHAGSRDLAQVLTEFGGVFINGYTSNLGKDKNVYVRGGKVEYTLITIDGVPVYDASGVGSYFDPRNISIDNVERIEILKGSQSTLYGSDAIAGVVNIITRKGGNKPFSLSAVADYGSYNTFKANVNVSGSKDIFDYNVGYSRESTDGFSEAKAPANATQPFEKDGYMQNSVVANFGVQAAKNFKIMPFVRYTYFKGDNDLDAFADEKDFTNTNKNLQLGITNKLAIGDAQLNLLYQYVNTNRHYLDDSTYVNPFAFYKYNQQQYNAHEHYAEAFAVVPFGSLKLTAGADFRSSNTDYSALQKDVYSPVLLRPSYSRDSVKQKQVGIYAALNYLSGSFTVEGGGRFNHHSTYGSNFSFNVNPSYLIAKHVKVFVNTSSGYKTPSLYQLFSIYGNKDLKPEFSVNFEEGVQWFTSDEKTSLRATYFNRNVKDVIVFFFNPTTFQSYYINQDKQKDHGIEVEANSKISDKLQLKLIYTYSTGNVTTRQSGKDTTYFNLLRRPKSTLNFFAGYQATKKLYINTQFDAIGERHDVYFDPVTFAQQNILLPNYVLVNFYAEYALLKGKLKIFADLRNILNADYSDIYGYNTAKFNGYGGVRVRL